MTDETLRRISLQNVDQLVAGRPGPDRTPMGRRPGHSWRRIAIAAAPRCCSASPSTPPSRRYRAGDMDPSDFVGGPATVTMRTRPPRLGSTFPGVTERRPGDVP